MQSSAWVNQEVPWLEQIQWVLFYLNISFRCIGNSNIFFINENYLQLCTDILFHLYYKIGTKIMKDKTV